MTHQKYHLIIDCPDRPGIVAAVSSLISSHHGMILEADHHSDLCAQWFFMRYEIDAAGMTHHLDRFIKALDAMAGDFAMQYRLDDRTVKKKVLLLASHAPHCVEDLLFRWHHQYLNADIVGVVANHQTLQAVTEWHGLPFFYVPINSDQKNQHFQNVAGIIQETQADLIVLARYMQILPADLCRQYQGRIINIHHSFLPSFIGANPYQQAFDRGVKLIGASAHYVTEHLDEGPIIEQAVQRITHRHALEDYIRQGQDIERQTLATAINLHLNNRVIIHGNKTIVFQ